jgi:D-glycero-D-manno-heptose 1,7-bisphosphate phosphatase
VKNRRTKACSGSDGASPYHVPSEILLSVFRVYSRVWRASSGGKAGTLLSTFCFDQTVNSESQIPRPDCRAVFLHRDGVINLALIRAGKPYPPATLDEFKILPGVREACQLLKKLGFLLVVATNQPDVGRGTIAREAVETIHAWLLQQLPIDRVMTCFHGGAAYGDPCQCRKPRPGMLLQAAEALKIDLAKSFMIGDRWRDVDCGFNAGCKTIFIDWGYEEKVKRDPDFRAHDLPGAAKLIEQLEQTNYARTGGFGAK